jgi:hypothetical protein
MHGDLTLRLGHSAGDCFLEFQGLASYVCACDGVHPNSHLTIRQSIEEGATMLPGTEPTLDDLLNEPIIRQLMASDGHTSEEIRALFQDVPKRVVFFSDDDDNKGMTPPPAHICEAATRAAKTCCLR